MYHACHLQGHFIAFSCVLLLVFKPGVPAAGQRAWFLIITFVRECMRVCVAMSAPPRGGFRAAMQVAGKR